MNKNILIIYLLLSVLVTFSFKALPEKTALSENDLQNYNYSHSSFINPNSLIYPLKLTFEKVLKFGYSDKIKYHQKLFENRFDELVYIANTQKDYFLPETADKYISAAGVVKQEQAQIPSSSNSFNIDSKVKLLERLRDIYPANSLPWIKLQQATETTKSLK